jgi:membrane-bound lytic murein transglycosylase A
MHNRFPLFFVACGLFLVCLAGCAPQVPRSVSGPGPALPSVYPVYTEESGPDSARHAERLQPSSQFLDSWTQLAPALAASRAYAARRPQDEVAVAHNDLTVLWADVVRSLDRLGELLPLLDGRPELLAANFRWLRLTRGADFSGYYEPLIKASLTQEGAFRHPLYRVPPDMHSLDLGRFQPRFIGQRIRYRLHEGLPVPYYSREDIDERNALRGRGLELAYAEDPLDVYFLHVQGSGRLLLPDGSRRHILYADKTDRPYVGIGRWLRDRGLLKEEVGMETVRAWLKAHPGEARRVMNLNENYVFFRFAEEGPVGGMGGLLTPWVSLAVDRDFLPLGSVAAFSVPASFPGGRERPLTGLGLAQDTGGAITGRRIDVFCGTGDAAAYTAGRLHAPGDIWLLLAR